MVKIEASANIAHYGGGSFKVTSSFPEVISPCQSLVNNTKIKGDKIIVVVHTDNDGKTTIVEKILGKEKQK